MESATSTVRVVSSAIPIETVSVPRSRLSKTKHGGVRLSNLSGIKTSSIPVIIERDCDILHLKIGLLNVRSLTFKAVIVNYHHIRHVSRKGRGVTNISNSKFQFTKRKDCVLVFLISSHEIYAV